jgi:hypothetical protein
MATELKSPELSRNAAAAFADKWKSYTDEKQHARGFWSDFFRALCGVDDEEIAGIEYEKRVKSTISGNQEYIDVYWKNVAVIEHKSAGENLDKAELQARGYWLSLPPGYRPKTIIISDFLNFRLIDVALNRTHDFPLSRLPENIHRFEAIISGNRTRISEEEITVDQEAAKLMANLYLELESHGFEGHETSIFLIRILFLLFGDDTGMWSKNSFLKLVMGTKEDGSDIGSKLNNLFNVLNIPSEKRSKDLGDELKNFPYVNGGIFAEKISVIDFNKKMRVALVDVANYNWTTINPTIFGSLFQLIKSKDERAALGEHYTSEENINKIVYPLFLDTYQERLAAAWDNKKDLKKLRQDLSKLKIFDPACGCGNFLVVAYRHLRQLELELIVRLSNLEGKQDAMQLDGSMGLSITLNQFYGIEIEEWPSRIAAMALFLTDHQENLKLERITGATPNRFPIQDMAHILNENALTTSWDDILDFDESTYILGNPPFIGTYLMSKEQKSDTNEVWQGADAGGRLDFVCNWFLLASKQIAEHGARAALVATNSIAQGVQPATLWNELKKYDIEIDFAHQAFRWSNEASGVAAVHVVIIGFSKKVVKKVLRRLWVYPDIKAAPELFEVEQINSYLVDAPEVSIDSRSKPLNTDVSPMLKGSGPTDGGFLSDISVEEADEIRRTDAIASKYLRRFIGARELIHNDERWCLWLADASPADLRNSKVIASRLSSVKEMRLASKKAATRELAKTPHLFEHNVQPDSPYVAVPRHSSEDRDYVPMSFFGPSVIASDALSIIPNAPLWLFAILQSYAFNVWNKSISGRLESRVRISNTITYNNFPFPKLSDEEKAQLEKSAQLVLDLRLKHPEASLADLYDSLSMPPDLVKAHGMLDEQVNRLFNLPRHATEVEILRALILGYEKQVSEKTLFS